MKKIVDGIHDEVLDVKKQVLGTSSLLFHTDPFNHHTGWTNSRHRD